MSISNRGPEDGKTRRALHKRAKKRVRIIEPEIREAAKGAAENVLRDRLRGKRNPDISNPLAGLTPAQAIPPLCEGWGKRMGETVPDGLGFIVVFFAFPGSETRPDGTEQEGRSMGYIANSDRGQCAEALREMADTLDESSDKAAPSLVVGEGEEDGHACPQCDSRNVTAIDRQDGKPSEWSCPDCGWVQDLSAFPANEGD